MGVRTDVVQDSMSAGTLRGNASGAAMGDSNGVASGETTLTFKSGASAWGGTIVAIAPTQFTGTLTAAYGAFALTGFAALFTHGYTLAASYAAYTLSGISAVLTPFYLWTNSSKNTSSFSNATKSSAPTWTNDSKNTSSFTNTPKS